MAFRRKLVFTIGRCQTTDQDGVVTWNGIRHAKIRYVFTDRTADFMNNLGHRCYPIYLRTYSSLGHAKSDSILLVGVLVTLNDIPVSACTLLAGVFVTLNDIHLTTSTLLAGVSRKSFWELLDGVRSDLADKGVTEADVDTSEPLEGVVYSTLY